MDKVFVDTSGWVALFVENDKHHKKAAALFESLKSSKTSLYTSDYVIDETITTILVRGNHRLSVVAGEALFSSKLVKTIHVAPHYLEKTWKQYQKYHDKEYSFTDVSSFALIKEFQIGKAFSFDHHFAQVGIEMLE